ncbi:hypothetical protein VNO78_11704 [Psophocarpus tetragonolobus]|uniref:Uncharacterized protein n=1 Tax=Psophocarpus tetragonolobus TaxID=3891 RepID=A0AAN9XNQ1_PSOTE
MSVRELMISYFHVINVMRNKNTSKKRFTSILRMQCHYVYAIDAMAASIEFSLLSVTARLVFLPFQTLIGARNKQWC